MLSQEQIVQLAKLLPVTHKMTSVVIHASGRTKAEITSCETGFSANFWLNTQGGVKTRNTTPQHFVEALNYAYKRFLQKQEVYANPRV